MKGGKIVIGKRIMCSKDYGIVKFAKRKAMWVQERIPTPKGDGSCQESSGLSIIASSGGMRIPGRPYIQANWTMQKSSVIHMYQVIYVQSIFDSTY